MTKMPDKIYAGVSGYRTFSGIPDKWCHTEYTRSDLIPQPVTDEARQRGLIDLIDLNMEHDETSSHDFNRACAAYLGVHHETIKAALSQPVSVIHVDEVVYVDETNLINPQSELESLKAENADLRRAVVGLSDAIIFYSRNEGDTILDDAIEKHAATINKAKEVENENTNNHKFNTSEYVKVSGGMAGELAQVRSERDLFKAAVLDLSVSLNNMIEEYGSNIDDDGRVKTSGQLSDIDKANQCFDTHTQAIKLAGE